MRKVFLTGSVILVALGFLLVLQSQKYDEYQMIACDVGQGDAILFLTPSGKQVLIDGGPGRKVLDCLAKYMPFWDRKVEVLVLTHPQKDHMAGLLEVILRYEVERVVTSGPSAETKLAGEWDRVLGEKTVAGHEAKAGEQIKVDDLVFDVLWPRAGSLDAADLNDTSVVLKARFGEVCAYLTGDAPVEVLESVALGECGILKVSHHGSKTGTSRVLLEAIRPKIGIVQVGRNSYGHPHPEVLKFLEESDVEILRNDILGDIKVVLNKDGSLRF